MLVTSLTLNLNGSEELLRAVRIVIAVYYGQVGLADKEGSGRPVGVAGVRSRLD